MIIEWIGSVLILTGAVFMLISSVGLIRLADFFMRNSASSKAIVFGLLLILLGVAIYYNDTVVFIETAAIMFFMFLITPLSAHIMSRAALITKVRFWEKTNLKELEDYEKRTQDEIREG